MKKLKIYRVSKQKTGIHYCSQKYGDEPLKRLCGPGEMAQTLKPRLITKNIKDYVTQFNIKLYIWVNILQVIFKMLIKYQ